jgi:multidrug efflux pump subunit AcrA (membrane-fusion protein)
MNLRRLRPVAAALLASVLGSAWGQGAPATAVVQEQRIDHRVVLGGTVVPARQVNIAAQLPGRVEAIAGTEGDTFPENTVLVALGDAELLAQRRSAQAQMGNAEAALRNAGVQFTRELVNPQSDRAMPGMGMPGMFDQFFSRGMQDMMGFQSPGYDRHADLIARETHIHQARSSYMQAQSQLEEIDAKLRDAKGYAPFDGVITAKLVEIGDTVQPGQPLLRFADTRVLQIEVEVPSRLMPAIRDGISVPARLDVNDALVNARVAQIFPMADPIRHTVRVKFDLPESAPAAPGMYAEVMIVDSTVAASSLPIVPMSSLVRRGSLPALFVATPEGKTELRLVRLGEPVDPENVSVLAGVRTGERVILDPQPGMTSSTARR